MTHLIQLALILLAIAAAVSGSRSSKGSDEFTIDEFGWAILFIAGLIVILGDLFWIVFDAL